MRFQRKLTRSRQSIVRLISYKQFYDEEDNLVPVKLKLEKSHQQEAIVQFLINLREFHTESYIIL
jgi:hypothetical protein